MRRAHLPGGVLVQLGLLAAQVLEDVHVDAALLQVPAVMPRGDGGFGNRGEGRWRGEAQVDEALRVPAGAGTMEVGRVAGAGRTGCASQTQQRKRLVRTLLQDRQPARAASHTALAPLPRMLT